MTHSSWRRLFRLAFGIIGGVFLVVVFAQTWESGRDSILPGWPAWLLAGGLVVAGLVAAGNGWVVLFDRDSAAELRRAFYAAQLGKYIPGGIWQVVGQIELTSIAAGSGARATAGFTVHGVTQLVAGAGYAVLVGILGLGLPGWARSVALASLGCGLLLDRRWMVRLARRLVRSDARDDPRLIPAQAGILKSFGWAAVTIAASSAAFAILLRSLTPDDSFGRAALVFAVAWTVGFLAVPFPSGLGVREAVLIAGLSAGSASVIGASIAHRLVTIAGEVALIAMTRIKAT